MPFLIPTANAIHQFDKVSEVLTWLMTEIHANDSRRIEQFVLRNEKKLSPEELHLLKKGLEKKELMNVPLSRFDILLGLNLLQVAALKAKPDTFQAFLNLYEVFTGMSANTLLSAQDNTEHGNGFNLLHLAVLNRDNPKTGEWIINHAPPGAGNAVSKAGQLPIELAFSVSNTQLVRPLLNVTSVIVDSNNSKHLEKLDDELQKMIGNIQKKEEGSLEARKEINDLIKQLKYIRNRTYYALKINLDWKLYFYFEKEDKKADCDGHIATLEKYLERSALSLDTLNRDQEIQKIKKFLQVAAYEYSDENLLKSYQKSIEIVLDDIADLLGTEKHIGNIYNKLHEYNYQGDLSLFRTTEVTNKSVDETLNHLRELTLIRNRFIQICTQVYMLDNARYEKSQFARTLVAIYNHCKSLSPLLQKYSPNLLEKGFIKRFAMGQYYAYVVMETDLGRWLDLYKNVDEINEAYRKIGLPYKIPSIDMGEGNFALLHLRGNFEIQCSTAAQQLVKYEDMEKRYHAQWTNLLEFRRACGDGNPTRAKQIFKKLAVDFVVSIKNSDDALVFLDELKTIYFTTYLNKSDREYIETYCEALETLNTLPKDLDLVPAFTTVRSYPLKVDSIRLTYGFDRIYGFTILEDKFIDLTTKQLKQVSEEVKVKVKEQNKKIEHAGKLLQEEKERLKALVAEYKKLAGDDSKYTEEADSLWQGAGESKNTNIDALPDYDTVLAAINRGVNAVATLEHDIKAAKDKITKKLDCDALLLKKLRYLGKLNIKETSLEKAAVEIIANRINVQRQKLKTPLSLVELTQLFKECEQSYDEMQVLLSAKEHYYFDTKKSELYELATQIKTLVSSYVKSEELDTFTAKVEAIEVPMTAFFALKIDADLNTFETMANDLNASLKKKLTELSDVKKKCDEANKLIPDAQKALQMAVSALNKKLMDFEALRKDLKFPNESKSIFDGIAKELKDLITYGKIGYVSSQDVSAMEPVDNSEEPQSPFRPIVEKPLIAEELEEFSDLPTGYRDLANQLIELSVTIERKEKEVKKAEDKAKAQSDKKESENIKKTKEDLQKAKNALRPQIAKLIELQQKIAITKVDSNSEIFKDAFVVVGRVIDATEDENITTIRDADTLLTNLQNKDGIEGFASKLSDATKETEAALKQAVAKQLQDNVASYNAKLAELKLALKEPTANPNSNCQKTAEKFTVLMGQSKFSKDPLKPNIDKLTSDLFAQPMKTFTASFRNIEQTYDDAIKAMDKEIKTIQGKYDAQKQLKEQEFVSLIAAVGKLKNDLAKWGNKKYLPLDEKELQRLVGAIDSAMSAAYDGKNDYMTFLDQEIAHLKIIEADSKKFIEDAKRIELQYQQRVANLNTLLQHSLKPLITYYDECKYFATKKETNAIATIDGLLNWAHENFGPGLTGIIEGSGDEALKLIEQNLLMLKSLLEGIISVLEDYKTQAESNNKMQLEAARAKLKRTADRRFNLSNNLSTLNKNAYEQYEQTLQSKLPVSVTYLQTATVADSKIGDKDELNRTNQAVTTFVDDHLQTTVKAEFNTWFNKFVILPYQESCQLYADIKNDENATKILTQCIAWDKEFEQAILKTNLVSYVSPRDVFSVITADMLPNKAEEMRSDTFKVELDRLKMLVEKHCANVNEKIRAYKADETKNADKVRKNYEPKLEALEELLKRYLDVQSLMDTPDINEQERLKKIVQDIKSSEKVKAKQYQDAIDKIEKETEVLEEALRVALTTLLDEALIPYRTAFQRLTEKDLSESKMSQAVTDLFKLLFLKAPNKITDIDPNIYWIIKASKQPFENFVAGLKTYVDNASKALDEIKDEMDQKNQAAFEKAEDERKRQEEAKQQMLLEQAQKEKEKAQSIYNAELKKLKNLQARYDAIQSKLKEPDVEAQQKLAEAIQLIEQKGIDEQYQEAVGQINQERRDLAGSLREVISKLLAEALMPYHTAIQKFSRDELPDSKVSEPIEKLYQLLLLKAPKQLADIVPTLKTAAAIAELDDDVRFKQFVDNLEEFVEKAATAVDDEKKRLEDKDQAALQKAEEERKKKQQKDSEDKKKKLLEKTQQETEKARLNYEDKFKELTALQARYNNVQKLLTEKNPDEQENIADAIRQIKESKKESAEQYNQAVGSIANTARELGEALKPAVSKLLAEALAPYHDALINAKFTAKELSDSQMPKAVEKLFKLLILKAPKYLEEIEANTDSIIKAKDSQFNEFIQNLEAYVKDAAKAVGDEKARLVHKEQDAKRKKEEEEARKKEAEETKRKKEEAARIKQEEEEARKLEEAKKKQEEEEARKKAQQGQGVATQNGTSESGTKSEAKSTSSVADDIFGALPIVPKTTTTPPVIKPKATGKTIAAPAASTTTTSPVIKPKPTGETVAAPSTDEPGKKQKKKKKKKKITDPPQQQSQEGTQTAVPSSLNNVASVEKTTVVASKGEYDLTINFDPQNHRHKATIDLICKLQRQIKAQRLFNSDICNLVPLEKALFDCSTDLRRGRCADEVINYQLNEIKAGFSKAIADRTETAKHERFSFSRFFKVLFGFSNKKWVDNDEIEIKHSNTVKFLGTLENECHVECDRLLSLNKRNYISGSRLVIDVGLSAGTSKKQLEATYENVSTKGAAKTPPKQVSTSSTTTPAPRQKVDTPTALSDYHKQGAQNRLKVYQNGVGPNIDTASFLKNKGSGGQSQ